MWLRLRPGDHDCPCHDHGLQIGYSDNGTWHTSAVPVPADVQCVVFVPNVTPMATPAASGDSSAPAHATTKTGAARAILPPTIPRTDAVFNISRVALLVNAFATNQLDLLATATQDALHQVRGGEAVGGAGGRCTFRGWCQALSLWPC